MILKIQKVEIFRIGELNSVLNSWQQVIMSQFTIVGLFGFHFRIHQFYLGDGDWFHTHPRAFVSVCIKGSYHEQWIDSQGQKRDRIVNPGMITLRSSKTAHNVKPIIMPCRTIAVTTPVINKWKKFKCD